MPRYTEGQTLYICNGAPVKVIYPGVDHSHRVLVEFGDRSREWRATIHLWENAADAIQAERNQQLSDARRAADEAWWKYLALHEKWVDLGGVVEMPNDTPKEASE